MASFTVPIITIIIGEGGSGGALALGMANRIIMLENAVYSVISPEGCASILYKDIRMAPAIAEKLKITAKDLMEYKIIDEIISEEGTIGELYNRIKASIKRELYRCNYMEGKELRKERNEKYRSIGKEITFYNTSR